jgi:Holliday junction resolvase
MSRKSKGINAERDLIHKFWATGSWSAVRVAGSGSMKYPSADILASNKARKLAIECKTAKEPVKYIPKEDVNQLKAFAGMFGAEPWFAFRFNGEEWFFLTEEDLIEKGASFFIDIENARKKGSLFEELIK